MERRCARMTAEHARTASASGFKVQEWLLAGLLMLLVPLADAATPAQKIAIDLSDQAIAKGDTQRAVDVLAPFAASTDPDVLFALAWAQMNRALQDRRPEEVSEPEMRAAIREAEFAIANGSAAAYNLLYLIYANGYGVPVDATKAVEALRRGADAGETGAELNYAVSLYQGTNLVDRDVARACPLILKLMKNDKVNALIAYQMGMILLRGQCGRKVDKAGGVAMIEIAAKRGVVDAERDFAKALEHGWAGDVDKVAALEWYEKAASQDDGYSNWRVGMAYVQGELRSPDSAKAVQYFEAATKAENAMGMASLAVMYATGDGVSKDYSKAMSLYQRSAELGNAHAFRGMAVMYMQGQGVPVDPTRAFTLYRKAVDAGEPEDPALEKNLRDMLKQTDSLKIR